MTTSIQILCLNPNQVDMINLTSFIRYQETSKVLVQTQDQCFEKSDLFIEDWTDEQKQSITQHLKSLVLNNGVVVVATQDKELLGFGCLEPHLFNQYLELSFLHVSKPYRHLGIGRQLFEALKLEALHKGATKLYLGAHPSIESQAYYKAMGCTLATQINEDIYQREPLDVQLEYNLLPPHKKHES